MSLLEIHDLREQVTMGEQAEQGQNLHFRRWQIFTI